MEEISSTCGVYVRVVVGRRDGGGRERRESAATRAGGRLRGP